MSENKLIITAKPVYTHEIGADKLKALNMPGIENHMGDIMPEVDRLLAREKYPAGTPVKVSVVDGDGKELGSKEKVTQ